MSKKSRQSRKPRIPVIGVGFPSDQTIGGMEVTPDGQILFYGTDGKVIHPDYAEVGAAYGRQDKSGKVIIRQQVTPKNIQVDPNAVLTTFDRVLAVDTNTLAPGSGVTAWCIVHDIELGQPMWRAKICRQPVVEFHEATDPLERVGWWHAIRAAMHHPDIKDSARICLIVDHDMNALRLINDRKSSFLRDLPLPERFTLVYASGDKRDYIANQALHDCDSQANRVKRLLQAGREFPPPFPDLNRFAKGMRIWKPE